MRMVAGLEANLAASVPSESANMAASVAKSVAAEQYNTVCTRKKNECVRASVR